MRSFLLLLLVLAVFWLFNLSGLTLAIMLSVLICVLLGLKLSKPTPPEVIVRVSQSSGQGFQ